MVRATACHAVGHRFEPGRPRSFRSKAYFGLAFFYKKDRIKALIGKKYIMSSNQLLKTNRIFHTKFLVIVGVIIALIILIFSDYFLIREQGLNFILAYGVSQLIIGIFYGYKIPSRVWLWSLIMAVAQSLYLLFYPIIHLHAGYDQMPIIIIFAIIFIIPSLIGSYIGQKFARK